MPEFKTEYVSNSVLLLPNKSIERNLANTTKSFLNKAFQQLRTLDDDLKDSSLRYELRRNYSTIFSPYADKIASRYTSEQDKYTELTLDKILNGIYKSNEEADVGEQDNSNAYLLLLGLIPFMFDVLDEEFNVEEVDIKEAILLTRDKTFKRIDTISNKMNYEDFLSRATEFLVGKGITRAIWTSHDVGQHIRPSHHFIMNGEEYDLSEGMYDPDYGDYVQCGELNGCRCTPRILLRM